MSYKKILEQLPELELFNDKDLNLTMSYRYKKEDDNIPILFLHGFNGNSKSWAYQFNFFKSKRSVIAIDAPGFGQSNPAVLDMEAIADMVFRLLKAMNISVCQVVGHSMGGMLAQIISSKYNHLVRNNPPHVSFFSIKSLKKLFNSKFHIHFCVSVGSSIRQKRSIIRKVFERILKVF